MMRVVGKFFPCNPSTCWDVFGQLFLCVRVRSRCLDALAPILGLPDPSEDWQLGLYANRRIVEKMHILVLAATLSFRLTAKPCTCTSTPV